MPKTRLLKTCTCVVTYLITSAYLGWFHRYNILVVALALVAILTLAAGLKAVRRSSDPDDELDDDDDGALRAAIAGIGLAGLVILTASGVSVVAEKTPLVQDWILNADRKPFTETLATLRQQGRHAEAAEIIASRLEQPLSNDWRSGLLNQAQQEFESAAATAETIRQRSDMIAAALNFSERHGTSPADSFQEIRRQIISDQKLIASVEIATSNEDWSKVFALVDSESAMRPMSAWPKELAQVFYRALISVAEESDDPFKQSETLQRAHRIASHHHLEKTRCETLLSQVLPLVTPVALPHGSTGELLSFVEGSDPAVLTVDVAVTSPPGNFITGLSRKDFSITLGQQRINEAHVTLIDQVPRTLQVVSAFAIPNSMNVHARRETLQGFSDYLTALGGNPTIRVLIIREYVAVASDWTTDRVAAWHSLRGASSARRTNLVQAAFTAVHSARSRGGDCRVLLFSGGPDGGSTAALDQTVRDAISGGVAIDAIGLRSTSRDAAILRRLAEGTGGRVYFAESDQNLPQCFRQAAVALHNKAYRIAIHLPEELVASAADPDVAITIGAKNHVVLKNRPSFLLTTAP